MIHHKFLVRLFCLATAFAYASPTHAHFSWLTTDSAGHVVYFFGESVADRTYHLPEALADSKIDHYDTDQAKQGAIVMEPVDRDDLVGRQSKEPVADDGLLYSVGVYGLYHGTKLTYYNQHVIGNDASRWPRFAIDDLPLQAILAAADDCLTVRVLKHQEPLAGVGVKLFCSSRHQEANATTDDDGVATFDKSQIEPGIGGLLVSTTDSSAKGEYGGQAYASESSFLTVTFEAPTSLAKKESMHVKQERHHPVSEAEQNSKSNDLGQSATLRIGPTDLPPLPEELTSFGAATAGETLYVYGGHTGEAHSYSIDEQSDRFWSLDLQKPDGWKRLNSGPRLQGLALVHHDGKLIRVGGFTAKNKPGEEHDLYSQNEVSVYDPASERWTPTTPLPEPRSSLDAAVLGDHLYVFGGWQLSGGNEPRWHETAWSLDLSKPGSAWSSLATSPLKRRAISVAAWEGKLYVIGGMSPENGPMTRVDIYDPENDSWTEGPSVIGHGMDGFGSSSFAIGGNLYVSTKNGDVQCLSISQNRWQIVGKVDPGRFFHRMVPHGDAELLLVGGANMEIGKFTRIDRIAID